MCTLSLVPKHEEKNGFILTSNRDEATKRPTSAPDFHFFKNKKMLFPKDEVAGGTWIGVSENNVAVCLLNGAFEPHKRKETYRMSRGLVVKELLASEDIKLAIANFGFDSIEPFTCIIVDYNHNLQFHELVWDGRKKYIQQLPLRPQLWSSSPLYSKEIHEERKENFINFLNSKKLTPQNLWEYHHQKENGNDTADLIIDRGFLKTRSITQINKDSKKTKMIYEDLDEGVLNEKLFKLN